jgi:hypothetical protein
MGNSFIPLKGDSNPAPTPAPPFPAPDELLRLLICSDAEGEAKKVSFFPFIVVCEDMNIADFPSIANKSPSFALEGTIEPGRTMLSNRRPCSRILLDGSKTRLRARVGKKAEAGKSDE